MVVIQSTAGRDFARLWLCPIHEDFFSGLLVLQPCFTRWAFRRI